MPNRSLKRPLLVWELLRNPAMVAITGKVIKNGRTSLGTVMVPANHSEARNSTGTWGLVIAAGLLLVTTTFICLILFAS